MDKLLLVDGHNLLCQAFFGIPERLLDDGRPVHGVIGFFGILKRIIGQVKPSHLLIVFDPEEKSPRTLQYDNYKANRRDFSRMPARQNPFSQLVYICKALDHMATKYIEAVDCEADDLIASYAVNSKEPTIIVSSDSDFFQLVNEKIVVLRYRRKESIIFDEKLVTTKYGVHPSRFIEFKSLVGDHVDNIKGIKGIGPKTALKVLKGERDLDQAETNIYQFNLDLIRLRTDIRLPYKYGELKLVDSIVNVKIGDLFKLF
jgi:DNA polymerase I